MELESKIEGLLFYKGESVEIKKLAEILKATNDEIEDGLIKLESQLSSRGLVLVRKDNSVVLGIKGELASIIEEMRKEELSKDLTKSSLETLSIILYKDGATRGEIDYIRGVNSSFILRNLIIRGLIEKTVDPKDSRRFIYKPTIETLAFMGINSVNNIPNYQEVRKQLEEITKQEQKND